MALHLLPSETLPIETVKDSDALGGGIAKQKSWEGRDAVESRGSVHIINAQTLPRQAQAKVEIVSKR